MDYLNYFFNIYFFLNLENMESVYKNIYYIYMILRIKKKDYAYTVSEIVIKIIFFIYCFQLL